MCKRKVSMFSMIISMLLAVWIFIPEPEREYVQDMEKALIQDSSEENEILDQSEPFTLISIDLPEPLQTLQLLQPKPFKASGNDLSHLSSNLTSRIEGQPTTELLPNYIPLVVSPSEELAEDFKEIKFADMPLEVQATFDQVQSESSISQYQEEILMRSGIETINALEISKARAWLKIIEEGEGPNIEISWPDKIQSEHLYDIFTRCYGLIVAVVNQNGGLFINEGQSGLAWNINLDRYSAFMREIGTSMTEKENVTIQNIYSLHNMISQNIPVRIFPRSLDAQLLRGFSRIIGANYYKARSIRAHYHITDKNVIVSGIEVDGHPKPGVINFEPVSSC